MNEASVKGKENLCPIQIPSSSHKISSPTGGSLTFA